MKRWFIIFMVALPMVILLSPCTPEAAGPLRQLLRLNNLKPVAFIK
jgi:hypothetical protein